MTRAPSLGLLLALVIAVPAAAEAATRRLAVVVGNNAGTGAQPALRYAETDAAKVARVLVEVGQVEQADVQLLLGASAAELERAFDALERTIREVRRGDARVLVLFYFSGHSDGEALELGTERFGFARLKARLAQLAPDVRLAIIDACRSGAAVAAKGGRKAPPFDIRLSDALVATGEVILASSAADELALESPEVKGSYFTHYLVSGLRGAADASGDGLVTLGEAYRFAYDHTVSATSGTLRDPQHPTYDFRLAGQGELVLTTVAERTAGLELPEGLERALVLDLARDQVVAEVPAGSRVRLALPPGRYAVRALRDGAWAFTRLEVAAGAVRRVEWAQLQPLPASAVAARGAADVSLASPVAPAHEPGPDLLLSLGVQMGGAEEVQATALVRLGAGFRFGILVLDVAVLGGFGEGAWASREVFGQVRVGVGLEYRSRWVALFAALEAGGGYLETSEMGFADSGWIGVGSLRAGLRLHLGARARVELAGEGVGILGGELARRVLPAVTLGAGVEF